MKKRNYSTLRLRMADAIHAELLRENGHWPQVKAEVRELLTTTDRHDFDGLRQLADAAAAAVLDSDTVRVIAVRKAG